MFNTNFIPMSAPSTQAQALATWREAASVVRARWQTYIQADAESRSWAFAVYVSALDAEEAAAAEVEALTPSRIAA
jgi:hypothetical protein